MPSTPPPTRRPTAFAWALLALAGLALVVWLVTLERCTALAGRVVASAEGWLRGVGLRGDVTREFVSTLPVARDIGPGRLELAVFDTVETVVETDVRSAFWRSLPLGTTRVEIRVPVTWRWHVSLSGPWKATVSEGVLHIEAPRLLPSLPPAIQTQGMEKRIEESWLRFDGQERLDELERSLTPELIGRSLDPRLLEPARAESRRALLRLAGLWLETQGGLEKAGVRAVSVRFADEPAGVALPHPLGAAQP